MKTATAALVVLVLLAVVGCTPNIYDVKMDRTLFVESQPGQRVLIDVRNTSSLQNFPLAADVESLVRARGYQIVTNPSDADIILRANIRYSGLVEDVVDTDPILGGAAAGAVAGGLAGAASGHHSGRRAAVGALGGAAIGAGIGYWASSSDVKNTFVTIVDLQVVNKAMGRPPQEASIYARVREKDLTVFSAAQKLRADIAGQIAGLL